MHQGECSPYSVTIGRVQGVWLHSDKSHEECAPLVKMETCPRYCKVALALAQRARWASPADLAELYALVV